MDKSAHAFNVAEAVQYGIDRAILIQHIRFWCKQNTNKKDSYHDGHVWMFQSVEDMQKHYPYWSTHKLHRLLRSMELEGILLAGNYNKVGYDRTKWYTLNIDIVDSPDGDRKNAEPIQDTKEDTKTDTLFEECWIQYGKKGNKATAKRYWKKLSEGEKFNIQLAIPPYIASREPKYRKDFQGWINPINRIWEDVIVEEVKQEITKEMKGFLN